MPVQLMCACAAVGAILGDSIGFYFGRRFGVRLLDGRIGRLMGRSRVESTMRRIRSGGIKAVILGRFVGVLRAVMPFAAGASGLSYARFLVASVLGATAWGVGFTLVGYLAGTSWQRFDRYVGRASTVLGIVIVTVALLVFTARKAVERQDRIRAGWQHFLARPRVSAIRNRYDRQLSFLVGRFRPGPVAGLQLTASLLALAVLGYLLGLVINQVVETSGIASVDRSVRDALADQPDDVLRAMDRINDVLAPAGAAVIAGLVGVVRWVTERRPRALVLLVLAVGGSWLLVIVVRELIERPAPFLAATGLAKQTFPATATTVVAATAVALAAVLLPRLHRWTWEVALSVFLLGVVLTAGFAELVLREAYLSDTVGGLVLGVVWGLAVATAVTTLWRPARRTDMQLPTRSG